MGDLISRIGPEGGRALIIELARALGLAQKLGAEYADATVQAEEFTFTGATSF